MSIDTLKKVIFEEFQELEIDIIELYYIKNRYYIKDDLEKVKCDLLKTVKRIENEINNLKYLNL